MPALRVIRRHLPRKDEEEAAKEEMQRLRTDVLPDHRDGDVLAQAEGDRGFGQDRPGNRLSLKDEGLHRPKVIRDRAALSGRV